MDAISTAMPCLEDKLTATSRLLETLLARHDPARIAVAWTGGKDSTVVLDVWRQILAGSRVLAVNLDTGCKFPEILTLRDRLAAEWSLDLHILRPDPADIPAVIAKDRIACCRALKVMPLKRGLERLGIEALLTGVRADENPNRQDTAPLEDRDGYTQVNPIVSWTEMDVWAHTLARGLPYCTLYAEGYRSLGCMPCTKKSAPGLSERSGRDQEKEARMAELRALGYF